MIDELINIFRLSGTEPGELETSTRRGLASAILNKRLIFLNGKGFLTYTIEDGHIYIRNLCILRPFRGTINLLKLRKVFQKILPGMSYTWRNRKKGIRRMYGTNALVR